MFMIEKLHMIGKQKSAVHVDETLVTGGRANLSSDSDIKNTICALTIAFVNHQILIFSFRPNPFPFKPIKNLLYELVIFDTCKNTKYLKFSLFMLFFL